MLKCYTCDKLLLVGNIKYHTADKTKVFCDAYCSHAYYVNLKEDNNEKEN